MILIKDNSINDWVFVSTDKVSALKFLESGTSRTKLILEGALDVWAISKSNPNCCVIICFNRALQKNPYWQ